MEWTKDLETGVDLIDDQHQEIIRLINDAVAARKYKNKPHLQKLTLDMLANYCATHFSQEENLQLVREYPEYRAHKKLHTRFLAKVDEFKDRVEKEGVSEGLSSDIEETVGKWLVDHIYVVDKRLAAYLLK